ncbi:MAG TPA: glycerol-3-phosphate 1-O-acyltransferase PlsY [Gammaproteobacteria bacterium]|nr:glycerol-3-phosphate 1-O-acyltransferase PlsY [Gammaproteobacteria bacterium]
MIAFAIKFVLAYLIGSLSGSLLLGRLRGVDIRTLGSGNAGGTNALRTQGKAFGVGVLLIDMLKGVIAAGGIPLLPLGLPISPAFAPWLGVGCAVAAVAGHVWPIWFGFRGGKGAATLVGVLLVLAPLGLVPVLGVWIAVLTTTGYVGLATIFGALAFIAYAFLVPLPTPLEWFAVVMALFVIYTHRSNLRRLREGTEHQASRAMLLRRRGNGT